MSAALVAMLCAPPGAHDAGPPGPSPAEIARDAERVARIAAGDEAAFEELFREYVEPLVRYAASYTKDPTTAREIVSDVFTAVRERREHWTPVHGAATYLYGAVRNRALNHERASRRRAQLVMRAANEPELPGVGITADEGDREADAEREHLVERVRRAVADLPATRREAMTLRWEHQMTPDQIAQVMGLSRASVYHLLERSLKTLRELLGPELR